MHETTRVGSPVRIAFDVTVCLFRFFTFTKNSESDGWKPASEGRSGAGATAVQQLQ